MFDKFEIGEVAVIFKPGSKFHGQECVITGTLYWTLHTEVDTGEDKEGYVHDIDYGDGQLGWVAPLEVLRKKKPPQREMDRKVSWDKCLWKPKALERV